MRWIIRCCHGLHRYQRCVVLCGLIRSSWTDASARTCVPHQKCFARWSLRYEFHAFCLCRSRATRIRSHRMRVYSHWFPFCTVSFCIETSRDLSSDRSNTFSDRSLVLCILALAFALVLAFFALALALRMRTDLHWHKPSVSVLLCSRDLEGFLSHLYPVCDPCAVPDEVRFDPHVLHPQHRHTGLDVVVSSFR